uniref:COesterase domain-containing protein n=1 Tax=Mesocestoides corti TaxID=53468 RepID=A0A5K3EYF9_MESCO
MQSVDITTSRMAKLFTSLLILQYFVSADSSPVASTRLPSARHFDLDGRVTVSGVEIRFSDAKLPPVHAIYGIRYASLGGRVDKTEQNMAGRNDQKPAKRRFMHSVAAFIYDTPNKGHLQKTTMPPVCPQPQRTEHNGVGEGRAGRVPLSYHLENQAEDCLTLNIFVPELEKGHAKRPLPVLIFVHGDSFENGSGNEYDFSLFASLGSVIAVTLNYRLGLLGFLTENSSSSIRGNFALFDLQAAIQWVHSNIHRFDGDPNLVTLMGHSHGAALVHIFATSLLSVGPNYYGIKRLIMLDGSANAPWATTTRNCDLKHFIERQFKIQQHPSASIFDLLRNFPITVILEIQRNYSRLDLDGCFSLPSRKLQVTSEKKTLFGKAGLLYGQTGLAGSLFYNKANFDHRDDHFLSALSYLLGRIFRVAPYPLADLVKYVYTQSGKQTEKSRKDGEEKNKIQEVFTDALFWSSGVATLRQHCSGQEQSSAFGSTEPSRYAIHLSHAAYGDDLDLLLGVPFTSAYSPRGIVDRLISQS